jgi:hypothetical protein
MKLFLRIAILSSFSGLVACAQWLGDTPAVDDQVIVARVAACNAANDGLKAANDYMQVGFANVYAACEAFFVNATRLQQNALAGGQTLDAGLIGATSILNATVPAASAARAITITAAGVVFGKSLLNSYVTVYAFGSHLYKVRQLVQDDMDNYTLRVSPPTDTCIAYANVQKLATLCTLSNMQALLDAQVAIPSQTVANGGAAPKAAFIPRARAQSFRMAPAAVVPITQLPSPGVSTRVVPSPLQ